MSKTSTFAASAALLAATLAATVAAAQGIAQGTAHDRAAEFPDTADGSRVLAVDLHTHSVFSDGRVWPSIRVEEAVRDGLDALALTEHLEYQRHGKDIPNPDRNRSYEVAKEEAKNAGFDSVILINGAEITRDMPPGHTNAVFLSDVNALLTPDARDAFRAANDQGAFVFWNHPNWIPQAPDAIARITPMHERLIAEGLLHGIEVANGTLDAYSEHALEIALRYDLTILGTSDIHGLVDWTHGAGHGGHRPMTLVLAAEKSPDALREALFAGRTVAWSYDDLIGRAEHVEAIVRACLRLEPNGFVPNSTVLDVTLVNACPTPFMLRNEGTLTFQNVSDVIRVERRAAFPLHVRMGDATALALDLTVLTTQIRPREHLRLTLAPRDS